MDFLFGPLGATFLLAVSTLILLYWYSSKKQQYWKERGVPYAVPVPFLGSIWEDIRSPLHDVDLNRYKKYGRIYGYFEGNKPRLSVADPTIIRAVLVKDFQFFPNHRHFSTGDEITEKMLSLVNGEDWKRIRTIITPTFTTGKIKRMLNIFKDCSNTLVENFRTAAEKGEPVDVKRIYSAFSMDIIASSAFSTKIDSHNDPNNEFVTAAKIILMRDLNWRIISFILWPSIMKFLRISILPPKGLNFFKNVTLQIIEERKKTGQTGNDFLQLLMDTAKEVADEDKVDATQEESDDIVSNYSNIDGEQAIKNILSKKSLSYNELVAQCVLFFLGGHDTTASTLSFASYLLALNPEVQEKLIAELDEALAATNGEMNYEAIQSMKYLDNVISETLRIYPPGIRLEREAVSDYKLADTGITVLKKMIVTIPVYAMHRDPKFFPNPEKFDPDRFTPEEREKREPYTYLPFGAGPRNCLGMRFSLIAIKVCLAHVLSNFRIKRCPETKVPLDFYIGQGLLQPKAVTLKMEIRKDSIRAH